MCSILNYDKFQFKLYSCEYIDDEINYSMNGQCSKELPIRFTNLYYEQINRQGVWAAGRPTPNHLCPEIPIFSSSSCFTTFFS